MATATRAAGRAPVANDVDVEVGGADVEVGGVDVDTSGVEVGGVEGNAGAAEGELAAGCAARMLDDEGGAERALGGGG